MKEWESICVGTKNGGIVMEIGEVEICRNGKWESAKMENRDHQCSRESTQ